MTTSLPQKDNPDQMLKILQESNQADWLANPLNQNLLKNLESRRQESLKVAERNACKSGVDLEIRLLLQEARVLRELIEELKTKSSLISKS